MSIAIKIKEVIDFNENLIKRIHNAFDKTLEEISENDMEVIDMSVLGQKLSAEINGYIVNININTVINELKKPTGKLSNNILEEKIKNTVNEIIIQQLSF